VKDLKQARFSEFASPRAIDRGAGEKSSGQNLGLGCLGAVILVNYQKIVFDLAARCIIFIQGPDRRKFMKQRFRLDRLTRFFTFFLLVASTLACNHPVPRWGIGGHYEEGREQFLRGRSGDMDTAIVALESVVSQDPTYKLSLTYLGRAYYRKGRYKDAFEILQRAVAVNRDDEVAWMALGLTELRLGQTEKGIETLKGGITLANKAFVDGYHNYIYFDTRGMIKGAIRRSAFALTKGAEEKENIIRFTDTLLALVDDEENFQRNTRIQNERPFYGTK
jgi:tetratricopeptide (TPR) repeat protein